jgi:hypothetical protein
MKFTKIYGIFLLTFIIGCAFSLSIITKKPMKTESSINYCKIDNKIEPIKIISTPLKTPKLEFIDEIDNGWTENEEKSFTIKLIETGEGFHGDEVPAKSGEKWFGLFQENDKFVLKSTKLKIERVYDIIIDGETKNKTGKSVSVTEKSEPIFLLKNSKFQIGEVKTLFRGNRWQDEDSSMSSGEFLTNMKKDFVQNFEMSGNKYSLKVIEALNKDGKKILALVLEYNGKRQVLHTIIEEYEESLGTLYWIGDLDGDSKPDFFISPNIHYNVYNSVLFISSKAKQNNFVEKVASFWTTGC